MKKFDIVIVLLMVGLGVGASIYGLPNVNANLLFGVEIILFGIICLHRMFLYRSDPKWILRYAAGDPEGVSSVFLLNKILKSPTGKKIFQYFFIPLGFVGAIGIIGFGIFLIFNGNLTTAVSADDFCVKYKGTSEPIDPQNGSTYTSAGEFCYKKGDMAISLGGGTFSGFCLNNVGYSCDTSQCTENSTSCAAGKTPILKPNYSEIWKENPSLLKKNASRKIAGVDAGCYEIDMDNAPTFYRDVMGAGIQSYEICFYPGNEIALYDKYAISSNTNSGIFTTEVTEITSPAPQDIFILPAAVK